MNAIWSPRAIRHLAAIRKYIERDSEGNAVVMAGRILDAIDILRTQPQMGRPAAWRGLRPSNTASNSSRSTLTTVW